MVAANAIEESLEHNFRNQDQKAPDQNVAVVIQGKLLPRK